MGVLVAANDVGIGCAGWVLRAIVAEIAAVLVEADHSELAAWLTDELSPVQLFSNLDVRALTHENQRAFLAAILPAYKRSVARGPEGWSDRAFWGGYVKLFSSLAEQTELLEQSRNPTHRPNLSSIGPHDGHHEGPGWPE